MNVIVDTVVWSLALRRKEPYPHIQKILKSLIEDQQALLLGPIRQEILSGYSNSTHFEQLKEKLSFFENEAIVDEDYVTAAEFNNLCRKRGIQGSHIDFLICAVAYRLEAVIYTKDKDFEHYAKHLPVNLFSEY